MPQMMADNHESARARADYEYFKFLWDCVYSYARTDLQLAKHEAEDVTQSVLTQCIEELRDKGEPITLPRLRDIASDLSIERARFRGEEAQVKRLILASEKARANPPPLPDEIVIKWQALCCLLEELPKLPAHERFSVTYRMADEPLTAQEAAGTLNMTLAAFEKLRSRTHHALAEKIDATKTTLRQPIGAPLRSPVHRRVQPAATDAPEIVAPPPREAAEGESS